MGTRFFLGFARGFKRHPSVGIDRSFGQASNEDFNSPILSCQEPDRLQGQLLAPLLHFTGSVDRALAFSMLSENLRSEVQV